VISGTAKSRIISQLKDEHGRIAVPGFYDGVPELEPEAAAELNALRFDEEREARSMGVPQLGGERDRMPLERQWFRPTLECNGVWGGYQGPGSKTIIPSWAKAKISARLVGNQDPGRIKEAVRSFLLQQAPPTVRVEVEAEGDVRAVSTSRDHPAVAAAAPVRTAEVVPLPAPVAAPAPAAAPAPMPALAFAPAAPAPASSGPPTGRS